LEYLTGRNITSLAEAGKAAAALRALGPGVVLVTSLEYAADRIAMLVAGPDGAWSVEPPRLPVVLNGCGDVTAALFLAHLLRGQSLPDALALTAAAIFAVIETTLRLERYELALVAAQDELLSPTRRFAPRRV